MRIEIHMSAALQGIHAVTAIFAGLMLSAGRLAYLNLILVLSLNAGDACCSAWRVWFLACQPYNILHHICQKIRVAPQHCFELQVAGFCMVCGYGIVPAGKNCYSHAELSQLYRNAESREGRHCDEMLFKPRCYQKKNRFHHVLPWPVHMKPRPF